MPNLAQIESLRSKYNITTLNESKVNLRAIKTLNVNFDKSSYELKALFTSSGINDNIIQYLENQSSASIVLLYIDITDFSQKCTSLTNLELSKYLDDYYDIAIPIIYRHGGEIEKIIGDGIVCLFGEPFLTLPKDKLFEQADKCAKDIIIKLMKTIFEVKIALHDGRIMYYKNKSKDYTEYTMIGKPLTELFRLESISENNGINYYHICDYDRFEFSKEGVYKVSDSNQHSYWNKSGLIDIDLKGVSWHYIKNLICTYKT
jgi:hypothetical protein